MGFPVARDIVEGHPSVGMEDCGDDAYRSLEAVDPRGNPAQMVEAREDSDGAVTTHSEESHVVEEEDATEGVGLGGWHQEGADEDIGASGFIDDGRAVVIEVFLELGKPLGTGTRHQRGATGKDQTGGFTSRVGINDLDWNSGRRRRRHRRKLCQIRVEPHNGRNQPGFQGREKVVDNSGLSGRGTSVSLDLIMRRTGLGKGLGTLMEPAPSPSEGTGGPQGAVRLFLKTPEKQVAEAVQERSLQGLNPVQVPEQRGQSLGWISATLFALDGLLIVVAGLFLSVGTSETSKVLILGSLVIGVAGALGLMGVWLRGR